MGLSDGERYAGVCNVIEEMHRIGAQIRHEGIKNLLTGLWYDFLGKTSNSLHRFMGSDSSNHYLGETSMLTVAFSHETPESEPWEDSVWYWRETYLPHAETLLEGEDRQVWRLLRLCESYFYYTNCYQDALAERLERVTRTVATVRGLLHTALKEPQYRCAWMMAHIVSQCFSWDEDDIVTRAGKAMNLHHDLHAEGQDPKVVLEIFNRHQFTEHGADVRLTDIVILMGHRFHHAHQHKQLLSMIEAWNISQTEIAMSNDGYKPDTIDADRLRRLLSKVCVERKPPPWKPYCHLTEQEG